MAVFLDGTWNDPTDNTNVWRLKTLVAPRDRDGIPQLAYYDTGVGVRWTERLRGGVGGYGLSQNVRQAYRWLVENHDDDDHVFVFGFSRGAFTARSLTGMIATCGLLRPGSAMSVSEIWDRYRAREDNDPLYRLERSKPENLAASERWLVANSRRVDIQFVGIWDTVGTLGIPFGGVPGLSRKKLRFHSTRLSKIFKQGCHALALDENRAPYDATLWTNYLPLDRDGQIVTERRARTYYPEFEQRWFVGAHSNVGGGYPRDPLAQLPLAWIARRANRAGLALRAPVTLLGTEHLDGDVVDSYKRFLRGAYRVLKFGRRYHRRVGRAPWKVSTGYVESVNETIDRSVFERWQQDERYRPESLRRWADQAGVNLDTLETIGSAIPCHPEERAQ